MTEVAPRSMAFSPKRRFTWASRSKVLKLTLNETSAEPIRNIVFAKKLKIFCARSYDKPDSPLATPSTTLTSQ